MSKPAVELHHGDCREVMAQMDPASVSAIVCDPPYGLEFMGKDWDTFKTGRSAKYNRGGDVDAEQIASQSGKGGAGPVYVHRPAKRCAACGRQAWSGSPCVCDQPEWIVDNSPLRAFQAWNESWLAAAYRVLKPGGHLAVFGGTRTWHRLVVAVEDTGFEVRDSLIWLHGEGFPKSHDFGAEPGSTANGNRIPRPEFVGTPFADGWGTGLKPAFEPICLARKPMSATSVAGNVVDHGTGGIHVDACRIGDEPRTNQAAGNKPGGNALNMSAVGMPQDALARGAIGRWPSNVLMDQDAAALLDRQMRGIPRFFYCAKVTTAERGHDNDHPTLKPVALMRWLIRLVTPPCGIVLDPFLGSGSTGVAAIAEDSPFIGIEQNADYLTIAERRIGRATVAQRQQLLAI